MGNFDTSALTGWASPDTVDTAAKDIKNAGKAIQDTAADATSTWAGLSGVYQAPEQEIVLSAFGDVATAGDDVQDAAITVSDAMTTFASEVRTLLPTRNSLIDQAATANDEPGGPDDDGRGCSTLQAQINSAAGQYKEAEERCAASILGAHSSPVYSTLAPGPGLAGTPLVGTSLSVGQGIVRRTSRSPILQPTFGGQPRLNAPLRMDQLPVDAVHQGTNYTRRPSGLLAPSHVNATTSHPQPVAGRWSHTTFGADPTAARPPAWAKWGGRGLSVAGAGITLWDAGSSRWRQDLAEHPEWGTTERAVSAGVDTAVVGGLSVAGAAAGAKAGAVIGTAIGGPVGLVVGVAVGATAGYLLGQAGKEMGEEIREGVDDAVDAAAEGIADAADKAGEVWDSLWG